MRSTVELPKTLRSRVSGSRSPQSSPEDVANYLARHYDEFGKYFDKKSIRSLQIEMLSRAGLPARANECLDVLLTEGLSGSDESRLRRVISDAEGDDPIGNRKTQFKESDSLNDLAPLVQELGSREDWDGVCEFGALLFERTRALHDAERLANALNNAGRTDRLVEFVEGNHNLLSQSKYLRMLYSWALFHEGALVTSRSQLANLSDDPENPYYRQLQVNLGIALAIGPRFLRLLQTNTKRENGEVRKTFWMLGNWLFVWTCPGPGN